MAKVKIQGHASGTGILTVTAPNTSTDRTITLPDETATLSTFDPDGAVTINDTGADVDFRVESDDNANMIFVDGGNDSVGIGTGSPSSQDGEADDLVVGTGTGHNGITIYAGTTSKSKIHFSDGTSGADCYRGVIGYNHNNDSLAIKVGAADSSIDLHSDGRGLSQFTAKAWISIDGTGTVEIRDSHNFTSITDNGTGLYNPNFTNAMTDANYAAVATVGESSSGGAAIETPTTSTMRVTSSDAAGTAADYGKVNVIVFGD